MDTDTAMITRTKNQFPSDTARKQTKQLPKRNQGMGTPMGGTGTPMEDMDTPTEVTAMLTGVTVIPTEVMVILMNTLILTATDSHLASRNIQWTTWTLCGQRGIPKVL